MEVPKWMTGSPAPTGVPPETPAPPPPVPVAAPAPQRPVQASPRSVPAVASVSFAPAAAAPAAAPASAGLRERLLTMADKRVRLSLTYPICAAVAGGVLVLAIGGFALGRWSVSRPAPTDQSSQPLLNRVPLGKDVLGGSKPPAVGKGAPAATPTVRAKGKWFLVIQTMNGTTPADYDEAARIMDFCKKEGCPATVCTFTPARSTKKKYIVWALTPFDASDSEPAKAYAHKVEETGKAYAAKYKTHEFRSMRSASGKFDPWFEQQR